MEQTSLHSEFYICFQNSSNFLQYGVPRLFYGLGKLFRINTQEIERYRELQVPLPRTLYEERLNERAQKLGSLELFERTCAKTGKKILTPYPPDSPYIIWDKGEYDNVFQ